MSLTGYREFDDFSHTVPSRPSNPHIMKLLQEIEENVQHFVKNVDTIESKTDLLNTRQDGPQLREEIKQLVSDTAQLAKITNTPIKKLRLQSSLSPTERNQFEGLMTSFSSAGIKFKNLQRLSQNLEKERLREARQRSYSNYSDDPGNNPFDDDSEVQNLASNDELAYTHDRMATQIMEQDSRLLEEREQNMRQLENDILDINDIFRDLGTMVHEQGDVIDNIEANVENAAVRVETGNKQLGRAVSHKRCSRKLTLIIVCILIIVLVAVVIGIAIIVAVVQGYLKH